VLTALTAVTIRCRAAILLGLLACNFGEQEEWLRFNGSDAVSVDVVAEDILGELIEGDLRSTTGTISLGFFSVYPGSAPAGTDHDVLVYIDEDYEEMVGKVSVITDAGTRGSDEYELRQDSANHGLWAVTLTSVGDPGEIRTDNFEIALWESSLDEAE
jgi:hypothetical protein